MKRNFFLLTILVLAMSFASCEKCTECSVYNKNDEIDSALEDMEKCGSNDEVEEFEALMTSYADSIQGRAECIRQ